MLQIDPPAGGISFLLRSGFNMGQADEFGLVSLRIEVFHERFQSRPYQLQVLALRKLSQ